MDLPRPFGAYTLLTRLAVGGMAEVYVAKAKGIGGFEKLVAIKVIHPRFSEDEHFVQMLVEEAKLSVLLTHMNIAQCFDLGCIDDTYFIVMEFVEGADAYRILKRTEARGTKLPFDVCAFITAEILNGLDFAHRKRDASGKPLHIVHRDVSPQNVLVSHTGEVKLVDFGIAKAAMRTGQTEAGVIKGKYYYMSPEQAWGDALDQRSDIFSTGIVLYELVTGEMLYQEDNIPMLLDRVRKADVRPPSHRRPDCPPELDRIVRRATQRNPEDRYQSAHDMAQELMQLLYVISPSFTSQRLADLMGSLFADQKRIEGEASGQVVAPEKPAAPPPMPSGGDMGAMSKKDFAPDRRQSVIFDLDDEEGETRADVEPYKRGVTSDETSPTAAPSAVEDDTALLGRADPKWEDETEQLGGKDEWDDATSVETPEEALRAARAVPAPPPRKKPIPKPTPPARPSARPPAPPVAPPAPKVPVGARPAPGKLPPPPPPRPASAPSSTAAPNAARAAAAPWPPPTYRAPTPEPRAVSWPPVQAPTKPISNAPEPVTSPTVAAPPSAVPAPASIPFPSPAPAPAPIRAGDPFSVAQALETVQLPEQARRSNALRALALVAALAVLVALGVVLALVITTDSEPDVAVEVISVPAGASVVFDGRAIPGTTPLLVTEGLTVERPHRLEVSHPGYETWASTFQATEGRVKQIAILTPLRGTLHVETDPPGAHVWINDVLYGSAPLDVPGLPMGQAVRVRASRMGRGEATETVQITAESLTPRITLRLPEAE